MFQPRRRLRFIDMGEALFAMAVVALGPARASGQGQAEYCAFEIAVSSPDRKPVAGIDVMMTHDGRRIGSAVTNEGGVARICDAPSDVLLDVEVGRLCGAVAVRHLSAHWMRTRQVYITYLNCSGEEWLAAGGCEFTIRTHDERGAPLTGVAFDEDQPQVGQREPTRVSDRFGRIFRLLGYGRSFIARLEKPGYAPQAVAGDCKAGSDTVREVTVGLKKGKP